MPSRQLTIWNAGELEAGFALGRRTAENQVVLSEFPAEPGVKALQMTVTTARFFARLRLAGTPIPVNDIWIAAAVMECRGRLLTFDPDFSRIPGLEHTLLTA